MFKRFIAMIKIKAALTILVLSLAVLQLPTGRALAEPVDENRVIRLATTTSTDNSGLLGHLLPVFENETGFLPMTWNWDTSNASPGIHYLTANLRGYEGNFGMATVKVRVVSREGAN